MASVDVYRNTSGVTLPASVASEVWAKAQEESAVMRLAKGMTLPGNGVSVPILTSDPDAYWTAEADEVTASKPTFATKVISPYKLSILVPFSNEFKRDVDALYEEVVKRMPAVMGEKFDKTVFGIGNKPGDNFDNLASATAVNIEADPWGGLVTVDATVAAGGGVLDAFVIAPQAKAILLTACDGNNRPLFVNNTTEGAIDRLVGAKALTSKAPYIAAVTKGDKAPAQLGFAGDWTSAHYGICENIKMAISDQASINVGGDEIRLFQRDMFAVRMDFEVGFRVRDVAAFARLVGNTPS